MGSVYLYQTNGVGSQLPPDKPASYSGIIEQAAPVFKKIA